jgi:predicted nucleic acid-binding protein
VENAVLDSYAILAFLHKEQGHEIIVSLLGQAVEKDRALCIAAPNWAEVRYIVERRFGATQWSEVRVKLLGLPLKVIDADQELAEEAGAIKANHAMSLADCFAAALAKHKKAKLYTGDPEFKTVEREVPIVWL